MINLPLMIWYQCDTGDFLVPLRAVRYMNRPKLPPMILLKKKKKIVLLAPIGVVEWVTLIIC